MELTPAQSALADALSLEGLDRGDQEEILMDLQQAFLKTGMLSLVERMDDQARARFEALLAANPTEEELLGFLRHAVPDADAVIAETIREMGNDILGASGNTAS